MTDAQIREAAIRLSQIDYLIADFRKRIVSYEKEIEKERAAIEALKEVK